MRTSRLTAALWALAVLGAFSVLVFSAQPEYPGYGRDLGYAALLSALVSAGVAIWGFLNHEGWKWRLGDAGVLGLALIALFVGYFQCVFSGFTEHSCFG